ncbi:MAG: glycoside hydrolase family 38 C-terminal domain-containing protein [Microbacterium sp.]
MIRLVAVDTEGDVRGFAEFLFGLAARQPREFRRLLRIRSGIYTTVAPLHAEIVRSPEPVPFAEIDRSAFRPIKPGTAWGKKLDCAWLRVTGEIPAGVEHPVVMLGVRAEGLICSPSGDVLDSVTTVFLQGDLPHSGGRFRPVHNLDLSSGRVEFFADVAYNGVLLYPYGNARFHGAHIATRDDEVFALYYDYLTLLALADATKEPGLGGELFSTLRAAYRRFGEGDAAGARAALHPHLTATSESDFVYDAIGHGHLDMAWLWPLRETHRKSARTYAKQLDNLARESDFVYGTSQPQQLSWIKQEHPALFERIKDAVASGRIELQGGFWVEPDTNLPNGESLVRQALVGRRFLEEEFGISRDDLRLCWLPDTFGYNGNLPQILRKSGMDWFLTIKLAWNKVNDFPHRTFHWEGIDGSRVLVHMPPEGDYNSRAAADNLLNGLDRYPEKDLGTALLVYGAGDGGGGPGEVHLELLRRERDLRGLPKVVPGRADAFFRRLEQREVPHVHSGELYLETHQGTYTTQGAIKRLNRVMERKLHNAEALAVLTGTDSRERLAEHWREVLLNQFHDIIPGSSITRVNTEAVATYERIEESLDAYAGELLALALPPAPDAVAVNLTSFPRSEFVKVGKAWQRAEVAAYAAAALHPAPSFDGLTHTADTLSNGILTLRFAATGEIVSCLDDSGTEHARDGLNRLVLHDDPYQFPFDAWDIKQDYYKTAPRTLAPAASDTTIDGPTIVRRHIYRFSKSTIEQRVILESGSDVVRFETRVDWHEKHRMLRTEFRPARYADMVRCEIQFGHIQRATTERDAVETAQFEICAHKWVALEDSDGGFALLNDGKYGHRVKDGLVSLNLLRSPTFPDKHADRGIHRFTYAFTPFDTGGLQKVVREGYRLNNPLLIGNGVGFDSFASTDEPGVIVETIKRAESGSGVVVRMYESLGVPTTTALRTTLIHSRAVEADLLESEGIVVDLAALRFGPFEIKTILLED